MESSLPLEKHPYRWTSADIAVAAGLAVAIGVFNFGFNFAFFTISPVLRGLLPGVQSIVHGFWYFSGPLALLIIRKPGAALYVNIVGTLVTTLIGGPYAFQSAILAALQQGIFSELPFALTRYRVYNLGITVVSGLVTAAEYSLYLIFFYYQNTAFLSPKGLTSFTSELISGIVIAGVMSWYLYVGIAHTGALDKFASGRAVRAKRAEHSSAH